MAPSFPAIREQLTGLSGYLHFAHPNGVHHGASLCQAEQGTLINPPAVIKNLVAALLLALRDALCAEPGLPRVWQNSADPCSGKGSTCTSFVPASPFC